MFGTVLCAIAEKSSFFVGNDRWDPKPTHSLGGWKAWISVFVGIHGISMGFSQELVGAL